MSSQKQKLSKDVCSRVLKICDAIIDSGVNVGTLEMAKNMKACAMKYKTLSVKQIAWICQTAYLQKLRVPPVVVGLAGPGRWNVLAYQQAVQNDLLAAFIKEFRRARKS